MTRKPVSNVDTAWLRMEDPANLMMITGVMVFAKPMDFERLKAALEYGLLRFARFRQRIVAPLLPGGQLYWEDDPDFDLNYHLQRASLPPPGDQPALHDLASLLASTQLDLSRPLWQMHLVQDYGDGCALICRLHHCIGDGLALVHVLLSLTDAEPDAPWPAYSLPDRRGRARRAGSALRSTHRATQTLLHQGRQLVTEPSRIADLARIGANGTKALGTLVLRWPDPKTVFKGPLGVPKRAAWSEGLALRDVKAIGKRLEGTVNDILLAAMAGGLRRYLEGRGEPVDGLNFRAVVPVNLRRPGTEAELGNKFGLVFLSLPIGIADPVDRLRELKRRMDGLKGSLEAPVAFGILNAIGMTPERIQDLVVNIFGTKGTAVMTNVIGPREQIYLAGSPLESLMFWVPQSGRLGLGVSILSYAGKVWMGVITDEGLVPDPEEIVAAFHVEFDTLMKIAQEAEEEPSLTEIAARLEETLRTLDALLQEEGVPQASGPAETMQEEDSKAPDHCQARTKAGRPCKNQPRAGSRFCRVHQDQAEFPT